jgi:hypothetical protein
MIKPPFTVLVLKDSHDPVTLRITRRMVFLFLFVFCAAAGLAGYGAVRLMPGNISEVSSPGAVTAGKERGYILPEIKSDPNSGTAAPKEPDVANMSIDTVNGDGLRFEFSFVRLPNDLPVYVWIIINPGAETAGEMIIHPRSPIFRGLPVDFRNGIRYSRTMNDPVTAVLPGLMIGIDFTRFRVLAYSDDGVIVIDKKFNIQNNVRL